MRFLIFGLLSILSLLTAEAQNCCGQFAEITAQLEIPTPTLSFPNPQLKRKLQLEIVIRDLKSVLKGRNFDLRGFELLEENISNLLSQVRDFVEKEVPKNITFSAQLGYAEELFQAFVNAKELLKFFGLEKKRDQRILRKIIQLNLKLLTLYDSNNQSVYQTENFAKILDELILDLYFLIYKFGRINYVPLAAHLSFESQVEQAKISLLCLSSFIRGNKDNPVCV